MEGNQKTSNVWLNQNNFTAIPDISPDGSQNVDEGDEMLRMVLQAIPGLSDLLLKNMNTTPDVSSAPDIVPQRSGFSVQDIIKEIPYMKESTCIKIMQQLVKTEIGSDEEAELVKDALKFLSKSTTNTVFQSMPRTILNIISEITEEYEQTLALQAPMGCQLDIVEEDEIEKELYGSSSTELKPGDSLIPFLNDASSSRSGFEESNKVSEFSFDSRPRVTSKFDNPNLLPGNPSLSEARSLFNRQNNLDTNSDRSFLSNNLRNNGAMMSNSSSGNQNQSQAALAPILEYLKKRAKGDVDEYPEHRNRKDEDGIQQKRSDEAKAASQAEGHSLRSERSSRRESRYSHRSYRSSHRSERSSHHSERSSHHSDRRRERRHSVTEERYREWKRHRD